MDIRICQLKLLTLMVSAVTTHDDINIDLQLRTPCLVVYKDNTPCEYILFLLGGKKAKVVACSCLEDVDQLTINFKNSQKKTNV